MKIITNFTTIYFETAKQSRTEIPNRPNAIYFTKKYSLTY